MNPAGAPPPVERKRKWEVGNLKGHGKTYEWEELGLPPLWKPDPERTAEYVYKWKGTMYERPGDSEDPYYKKYEGKYTSKLLWHPQDPARSDFEAFFGKLLRDPQLVGPYKGRPLSTCFAYAGEQLRQVGSITFMGGFFAGAFLGFRNRHSAWRVVESGLRVGVHSGLVLGLFCAGIAASRCRPNNP